jgi:hypothetical protein
MQIIFALVSVYFYFYGDSYLLTPTCRNYNSIYFSQAKIFLRCAFLNICSMTNILANFRAFILLLDRAKKLLRYSRLICRIECDDEC